MRRLKDLDAPVSPIEADAADLLRSAVGYEPPLGQKQRVRTRLLQVGVTRRRTVSRPAVAAVVILCAAAASAAVGRHWIVNTIQAFATTSPEDRARTRRPSSMAIPRGKANGIVVAAEGQSDQQDQQIDAEIAAMTAAPERPAPAVKRDPARRIVVATTSGSPGRRRTGSGRKLTLAGIGGAGRVAPSASPGQSTPSSSGSTGSRLGQPLGSAHIVDLQAPTGGNIGDAGTRLASAGAAAGAAGYAAGRRASRDAPASTDPPIVANVEPADETGLVFEAMRALRQDRRPARASRLLDEYLRRHPEGSLCEEALALSVEAAGVRGDARTRALIRSYLNRYPSGHFRAAVERTRARLAP
jgi:hypothetical protein